MKSQRYKNSTIFKFPLRISVIFSHNNFIYYVMNHLKLFLTLYVCLISSSTFSQSTLFDQQMQVGFVEKQGQYAAPDVKLVNEAGDTVSLGDIINKPTILNLVYYNCPGTCSPLMWGISKFIDGMDLQLGKDYDVLTISFDPSERIDLGIKRKPAI